MQTDEHRYLREQAERCRRLAATCADLKSARVLRDMAVEFEARAQALAAEPQNAPTLQA
jgi:hypothetical protein